MTDFVKVKVLASMTMIEGRFAFANEIHTMRANEAARQLERAPNSIEIVETDVIVGPLQEAPGQVTILTADGGAIGLATAPDDAAATDAGSIEKTEAPNANNARRSRGAASRGAAA